MTLQELEATPWAAAFKRDAPVSYAQALAFAAQPQLPVVVRRTDESGFWVWAVAVEEQPDFWMDALDSHGQALALCHTMGWSVQQQ